MTGMAMVIGVGHRCHLYFPGDRLGISELCPPTRAHQEN
jgi:hypothetical protein